jgi:hypothetical protein
VTGAVIGWIGWTILILTLFVLDQHNYSSINALTERVNTLEQRCATSQPPERAR